MAGFVHFFTQNWVYKVQWKLRDLQVSVTGIRGRSRRLIGDSLHETERKLWVRSEWRRSHARVDADLSRGACLPRLFSLIKLHHPSWAPATRANVEVTLPLFRLTYESWTRNLVLIESRILKFFSETKGLKVNVVFIFPIITLK